jgi:predicted nucleic-acid-binding protein
LRITADTSLLVRAAVPTDARLAPEDARQAELARTVLTESTMIAVPLPALCEFVWVLSSVCGFAQSDIAESIRRLVAAAKVVHDAAAVEAGLAVLEAGGDFADGAIAAAGAALGGTRFVTFDPTAARLLSEAGHDAELLA